MIRVSSSAEELVYLLAGDGDLLWLEQLAGVDTAFPCWHVLHADQADQAIMICFATWQRHHLTSWSIHSACPGYSQAVKHHAALIAVQIHCHIAVGGVITHTTEQLRRAGYRLDSA